MKIKNVLKYLWSLVLNFTAPRYAIMFLNSEIYIVHVINHEWNKSIFVASAMCFVWNTKPDFPTIGIRARFSYHVCITCDCVLEFKKTVIFVFSNFCIKLLFHKPGVHWSIYAIYCFAWFQEDTAVTFVLCRMFLVFVFIKDTIYTSCKWVYFSWSESTK